MSKLKTKLCGIEFPNPIWTAAGPAASDAAMLKRAADGGAGGLVTKTISVKPAQVVIPNITSPFSGSLLNAELWSEMDYLEFIDTELPAIKKLGLPVIVSLGYSPEELAVLGREIDRCRLADAVEFSIHYIGKDTDNLRRTAESLKNNISVPVFAKFSPSINDLAEAVQALEPIVDGFVAINSLGPALDFDINTMQPKLGSSDGRGWLSGRAILPVGLHFVASIVEITSKPVIGVGGIRQVEDVVKYLAAGASAVQLCSLAILKGQQVYGQLANDLELWLNDNNYRDLNSLIGAFQRKQKRSTFYLKQGVQLYPDWIAHRCNFCKICEKACIHQAIGFVNDKFIHDEKKCLSCGLCVSLCPKNALIMKETGI
ncbi:MAG TPA: diguanylate cyclase [bacterium]|nr:diguanylate cyclase [bacterium]